MSWARVDDGFWCHPKVLECGFGARGVWVTALSYCAQYGTDGLLSRASATHLRFSEADIAELVGVGLFDPHPRGWVIHDYLEYNPSKEDRAEQKEQQNERKRKSRAALGRDRRSENVAHCGNVTRDSIDPCHTTPSRPVPEEEMILPRPHARDVGDGEGEGIEGGGRCEVREVRRGTRDDPERTAAAAGSRRLQRLGLLGFHHVGEHAAFLAELSRKTPEEWRIAEPVIRQMVNAKNFPVTPRHLVDKWHRYGAGLPPLTAVDVERDRAARKPVVAIRADPPPQTYHRMIDLNTVAE